MLSPSIFNAKSEIGKGPSGRDMNEWMNFIVIANGRMAADDNVCAQHVARTEHYVGTDLAIRADVATVANDSARFDYRSGMNSGRHDAPCKTSGV